MDEKERTPLYRVEEGVAWLTLNRPERNLSTRSTTRSVPPKKTTRCARWS